ncbi:MAG: TonB-dependent receptor domain-containing protein [Chitinophagales bacterium]
MSIYKVFRFFILLFILPLSIEAQTITLKNLQNEQVISNATVLFEADKTQTTSNTEGEIEVHCSEDKIKLRISHVSYETLQLEVDCKKLPPIIYLTPNDVLLNQVTVQAFESRKCLFKTAGAIATISPKTLQQSDQSSLVQAFNTISGVRMEERANGSYRISIRGSSLRSPFNIRNVKMYWNNVPLTKSDGATLINLIDPEMVGNVEVIKGPASSLYGAGNGGAVLLQTSPLQYQQNNVEVSTTLGSYGLWKSSVGATQSWGKNGVQFRYNHQESDGYRDHNALNRDMFSFNGFFDLEKAGTVRVATFFTLLDYQIPGGLNADQRAENPRQARPGSAARNASIENQMSMTGIDYALPLSEKWEMKAAMSITTINLVNPFNTNFKTENQTGFSIRPQVTYTSSIGENSDRKLQWVSGMESQFTGVDAKVFGNVEGEKDTLQFADYIEPRYALVFSQASIDLPQNLTATIGASYNTVQYDIERVNHLGDFSENDIRFEGAFTPRVALIKTWKDKFAVHGSVSWGFSPPSLSEVRTSEGSINTTLQAEKGTNYELGFRANGQRFQADVALFSLQLRDAFVTKTAENGTVLFENAGSTSNQGIEAMMAYQILQNSSENSFLSQVNARLAYTYNHFRFKEYFKKDNDFSGNAYTGVAPHILNLGLNVESHSGIFAHFNFNFTDEIPLNDANTVFSNAYNLLNVKAGYRKTFNQLGLEFFGGLNNLLDEEYSLGNDLNPFGGRYFQPAAERNFYGGVRLKFLGKK